MCLLWYMVRTDFPPKLLSCAHHMIRYYHAQHSHCVYFVLWLEEREVHSNSVTACTDFFIKVSSYLS